MYFFTFLAFPDGRVVYGIPTDCSQSLISARVPISGVVCWKVASDLVRGSVFVLPSTPVSATPYNRLFAATWLLKLNIEKSAKTFPFCVQAYVWFGNSGLILPSLASYNWSDYK